MVDQIVLGCEFFDRLTAIDVAIAAGVAAAACPACGGPLHVGNFARKPRGGLVAMAGEAFTLRAPAQTSRSKGIDRISRA
jgi:hypothetical protein